MMHRLHTPIAVVAMAMYALLTGCSGKKNHADDVLCMIGSDSLSLRQVNRLVPDSLPRSLKIARAALELVLVKSAPREKLQSVDSALAGRISSDLAEQLSRQTTDAWSSEAARYLYNAVKIIRLTFLELRSSARVLARVDSLVSAKVTCCDSAVKKELRLKTASPGGVTGRPEADVQLEPLVSRLFSLPPVISRILCEFVTTAEVSSSSTPNTEALVKGLVYDSAHRQKTALRKIPSASASPVMTVGDIAKAALKVRNQSCIKDSIEKHIHDLEALYKKYLKVHQNMAGTIWVTFQIHPDGSVASARIKTSKIIEKDFLVPLHDYITEKIHFKPIPEKFGSMEVEFPFEFTPEN